MRPERRLADRHGDRAAGVDDLVAAREAVGGVHRDRADAVVAEVLLHLADERRASRRRPRSIVDLERVVDLGQLVGEDGLDHDALDLLDAADVAFRCVRQPFVSFARRFQVSLAERLGAGDDFHDLLGDLGLARPVHLQGQVVDQLARRSRTRCASRSCARRARTRSTRAAPGRPRSRRSRGPAAARISSGSGSYSTSALLVGLSARSPRPRRPRLLGALAEDRRPAGAAAASARRTSWVSGET